MKKQLLCLIMAAVLLLTICTACGGSGLENDPNVGIYKLHALSSWTVEEYASIVEMDLNEAKDSFVLELKGTGEAVLTIDGESETIKWKVNDDGSISLYSPGESETIDGTIENGILKMDFGGEMIELAKE